MRSLFLTLVLANLLFAATQFSAVREFVVGAQPAPRAAQLHAEKLRIIRSSSRTTVLPTPAAAN